MPFIFSSYTTVLPIVTQLPGDIDITAGNGVILKCIVMAKPRDIIQWLRNNTVLKDGIHSSKGGEPLLITHNTTGNCSIADPPSQCVSITTLQIFSAVIGDSAVYTCLATNEAGSNTASLVLTINGKICV